MLRLEPAASWLEVGHWAAFLAKGSAVAKQLHHNTPYNGLITMLIWHVNASVWFVTRQGCFVGMDMFCIK